MAFFQRIARHIAVYRRQFRRLAPTGTYLRGVRSITVVLTTVCFITAIVPAFAQSPSRTGRLVTLRFDSIALDDALKRIANESGVTVIYSGDIVPLTRKVSLSVSDASVVTALQSVLQGTDVTPQVTGSHQISLVRRPALPSQKQEVGAIQGRVIDSATKRGIGGAMVSVEETKSTTTTNDQGQFLFSNVSPGTLHVVVKLVGYKTTTIPVVVKPNAKTSVTALMHPTTTTLSEVITTATGRQRKVELGNAVTSINVDSVMRVAPVTSVTDLLETRVPGLQVLRTSGVPGDPARLRFRGTNSITRDNDPIVIVDGIRVAASERLSTNTAPGVTGQINPYGNSSAPSAIDQIDPNTIETINVFNGPSAAAMYGADAANGVIVITTKRGQAGHTHWSVSLNQGMSRMLGRYPINTFNLGHHIAGGVSAGKAMYCPIERGCITDSVVMFQALNDPRYSVFGTGYDTRGSFTVSGGSTAVTYSLTGSASSETGIFELPQIEQQRYTLLRGIKPARWMVRPDRYTAQNGSGSIRMQLAPRADVTITSRLSHGLQQQGQDAAMITTLQSALIVTEEVDDPGRPIQYMTGFAFPFGYGQKTTDDKLTYSNAASVAWSPWEWLPLSSTVGMDVLTSEGKRLKPLGLSPDPDDSRGAFSVGRQQQLTRSGQIMSTIPLSLSGDRRLNLSVGINARSDKFTSLSGGDSLTIPGVGELTTLKNSVNDSRTTASYGWFIQPQLDLASRFFVAPGIRIDGGSGSGVRSTLSGFPKTSFSWLISDEPWFPKGHTISELHLRTSIGNAGVQPDLSQGARLFSSTSSPLDGTLTSVVSIRQLGNTKLRPERAWEWEGGFDAGLFDRRANIKWTMYRKTTKNAIITVTLPPSFGSSLQVPYNIGVMRNTGIETTIEVNPIQTASVGWFVQASISKNKNVLVSLAPGLDSVFGAGLQGNVATKFVPGYPADGIWAKPVLGYVDLNNNGRIESDEIRVGDTTVYLGPPLPNYQVTYNSTVTLFGGRLRANGTFEYVNGRTQVNTASKNGYWSTSVTARPLGMQAAWQALDNFSTGYGMAQVVNTLRWQSLSINIVAPQSVANMLHGRSVEVALQGSNVGLWTNYRGKDPNVSAYTSGNRTEDMGQLPAPQKWSLMIRWSN